MKEGIYSSSRTHACAWDPGLRTKYGCKKNFQIFPAQRDLYLVMIIILISISSVRQFPQVEIASLFLSLSLKRNLFPSRFFLPSNQNRVDLLSYESKTTDIRKQYDRRAEKNLDEIVHTIGQKTILIFPRARPYLLADPR